MKEHALAFARIVLGVATLLRGIAETFGVWGGPRMAATTTDMASAAGVSHDLLFYVVAVGLMILGVAMLLGIMANASAWALLVVTVWHGIANSRFQAFFAHDNGCEPVLMVAALCCVIATHGPGVWKVELPREKKK